MRVRTNNLSQFKSIWLGLFVVLTLWCGLIFNLFHWADSWLYDQLINLPSINQAKTSSVLLVETPLSYLYSKSEDWGQVIDKLKVLKPKAIVLPSLPLNWPKTESYNAATDVPIFFGQLATDFSKTSNQQSLADGLILLPPIDGNAYREHWLAPIIDDKVRLSLVAAVTQHISSVDFKQNQQRYFIDFREADSRMPVVNVKQLLSDGLVQSLVEGKVVLVGFVDPFSPELLTPIGGLSLPMYQAYALDTLLKKSEINYLGLTSMMLLVLTSVIIMYLFIPRVADRYQPISFVVIVMLTLVMSWLLLMSRSLWIRPGDIIFTELLVFMSLYYTRYEQHTQHLTKMALNSRASMEQHWLPQNFYASEEHWNQISNMVSQTLSLNRTIFLERVVDDHRLKEIQSLNCNLDDINEMRRDYQRAPYTQAIAKGGVYKLDREFLVNSNEAEVQYLVPLSFGGEIQGFWAFSINADHHIDENKLIFSVEQFSSQISEMLFHRGHWLKHQEFKQRKLIRLLSMKFDEPAYGTIYRSINFLTQRLTIMEAVMDGMETSAILFDLFGRVLQVNKSMSAILSGVELAPYSSTAADLISELTTCELGEARNYLNYIILDRGTVNLPVTHKQIKKGYMLSVRALHNQKDQVTTEGEVRPFEIIGLLCELIDMSRLNDIYAQKEKVIDHLSGWLRTDLSTISIGCDLIQDDRMDTNKRNSVAEMIKEKVSSLALSIERVNAIIQSDLVTQISAQYPIESKPSLVTAIEDTQKKLNKKVTFKQQWPFYVPLVVASASDLKKLFGDLLNLLVIDAAEESEITIQVINHNNELEFNFTNQGFGIPNEQLQKYLDSEQILDNEEFKVLRSIKQQVLLWKGTFKAESSVGEGMHFSFKLESFNSNEK